MNRRRALLQGLAAAPLLPAALTQTATPPPAPSPSPSASPVPPGPVARALAEAARHRYEAHLPPGDLEEVARTIQGNLQAAERLKSVALANGDEPATTFSARLARPVPRPAPAGRRLPRTVVPRRRGRGRGVASTR